jgi:hypothetical protein
MSRPVAWSAQLAASDSFGSFAGTGQKKHPRLPVIALGGLASTDLFCVAGVSSNQSCTEPSATGSSVSEFNTSALEDGSKVQLYDKGGSTDARATAVKHLSEDRCCLMGVQMVRGVAGDIAVGVLGVEGVVGSGGLVVMVLSARLVSVVENMSSSLEMMVCMVRLGWW